MIKKVKYIFSINTGRSGSRYLCEIFNNAYNICSFHEPTPTMLGQDMWQYNWGGKVLLEYSFKNRMKLIKKTSDKGFIYCETNNGFIKGFYEFVLKSFSQDEIGVVFLRRPLEEIVQSLIDAESIPNSLGWMLWSNFPTNIVKCDGYSDEELCRWYVKEVWARGEKFKEENHKIRVYDVDLYDLNNIDNVKKMFAFFGLQAKPSLANVVGKPINTKEERYEKKLSYF